MMKNEMVVVLLAKYDEGQVSLIMRNLKRATISNQMLHFSDGQETLDFFFQSGSGPHRVPGTVYLPLWDIHMPKVNGIEVLRQIKEDGELCKTPVIMISTSNDPRDVEECHRLGCSSYMTKPVDYERFVEEIRRLSKPLLSRRDWHG